MDLETDFPIIIVLFFLTGILIYYSYSNRNNMKLRKKRMERYIKLRKIGMIPYIFLIGFFFYIGSLLGSFIIGIIRNIGLLPEIELFQSTFPFLLGLAIGAYFWIKSEKQYNEWRNNKE